MDAALLVVPGLVALGAAAGGSALWLEQRRTRALHALAQQQGWSLTRRDDVWATAFEGEPFGRGSQRRATHVLLGAHGGRDLVAFDLSFRTSSTDGEGRVQVQQHRYAVAALSLPAAVPLVEVVPTRLPGGLQFESDAFNRRYRVRAEEPRLAYDVLGARSLQLLLDRPPLALRLHGAVAVTWERGRLEPEGLLQRLSTLSDVLDGVPSWVWEDRR